MRILLFIALGMSILLVNCRKNYSDEDLIGRWEVEKIIPENDSAMVASETYILEFLDETNYQLTLDVNSCSGSYTIIAHNTLDIEGPSCTEACCDSEFAVKLSDMLDDMNQYEINGRKLILLGEGKMILKAQ